MQMRRVRAQHESSICLQPRTDGAAQGIQGKATSHVTRHTSHVTRHTSHVTRHKPRRPVICM